MGNTLRRITYVLMALMFGFVNELSGLNNTEKSFEEIFNLIYKQQFTEAHLELTKEKDELDKWEYHILYLDLLCWEALSSNSKEDYDRFESALKNSSSALRKTREKDRLVELITLSYSFRLEAIRGNLISMMLDFLKINHIIQRFDTTMLSTDQQEVFKIYLALFNIGKSKLLFNNSKVREDSIRMLESCLSSSNTVYQTIAKYFLSKIYLEVDHSPAKARIYCKQLCNTYPTNKIFIYNLELCNNLGL